MVLVFSPPLCLILDARARRGSGGVMQKRFSDFTPPYPCACACTMMDAITWCARWTPSPGAHDGRHHLEHTMDAITWTVRWMPSPGAYDGCHHLEHTMDAITWTVRWTPSPGPFDGVHHLDRSMDAITWSIRWMPSPGPFDGCHHLERTICLGVCCFQGSGYIP